MVVKSEGKKTKIVKLSLKKEETPKPLKSKKQKYLKYFMWGLVNLILNLFIIKNLKIVH
jgi:hypothetical protein